MSLMDDAMKHVPEYYRYMYLDGFTPDEIMYAAKKKMNHEIQEGIQKKQQEKDVEREAEKQLAEFIEKKLDELLEGFNK